MKPSDHPEYFRLPPPEGRSRESTIVLTREGRFLHDGALVEHAGMRRAFASWVKLHPDDGRPILDNGYDWSYLEVQGALYFVQSVRLGADRRTILGLLLDGRELPVSGECLRADAEGLLSMTLPEGAVAAFTPAAQLELSPWLAERSGQFGLLIDGQFSPIPNASAEQRAAPPPA